MSAPYSIAQVNALASVEFVRLFGAIYEHSPWVAERAAALRPFPSAATLALSMQAVVEAAPRESQLALMRAHPQLLGRPAAPGLTPESRGEQTAAGLAHCSPEELARLAEINRAYLDKFGFPFIVAVRGMTRGEIIARMEQRLANDADAEFVVNLGEIAKIAGLRLAALVA